MLSIRTVEPHTLELLKRLMAVPQLAETRLVGGTSLALQYGHRQSIDLDFFGQFNTETDFAAIFSETMNCRQISVSRNIKVFEVNGVKVDLVNYKYPWIDGAEHSTFRALMSLMYFDDAERQPMPRMFSNVTWEEMKATIQKAVRES